LRARRYRLIAEEFAMGERIVIVNGSGSIQAGFAGHNAPRSIFPPTVGSYRDGMMVERVCVGNQALRARGAVGVGSAIRRGTIDNWNDMEKARIVLIQIPYRKYR
jgi:actin-related protein